MSTPNVANYAVRLNLLKDEFRYQDFGIYDRTHLRFFTRASVAELIEGAGLRAVEWHYTPNLTEPNLFRRTLGCLPPPEALPPAGPVADQSLSPAVRTAVRRGVRAHGRSV